MIRKFMTKSAAAEELGMSTKYISQLITGIEANTPERYTVSDVFKGGRVAVRFVALMDYAAHRGHLDKAPPYDPVARERELGLTEEVSYT